MNPFEPSPFSSNEQLDTLLKRNGFRVERIVSWEDETPHSGWLEHEEDEWLLLLEGNAHLRFDASQSLMPVRALRRGEPCFIMAHQRHVIAQHSTPTIWLRILCTPAIDADDIQ